MVKARESEPMRSLPSRPRVHGRRRPVAGSPPMFLWSGLEESTLRRLRKRVESNQEHEDESPIPRLSRYREGQVSVVWNALPESRFWIQSRRYCGGGHPVSKPDHYRQYALDCMRLANATRH